MASDLEDEGTQDETYDEADLDLDIEGQPPKSKRRWLLIASPIVVLLMALGVYFLIPSKSSAPKIKQKVVEIERKPAIYIPFKEEFTAAIIDSNENEHHMVIAVTVMTRDEKISKMINTHMPTFRSELLSVFEEQKYEDMQSIDGKRELRNKALKKMIESIQTQKKIISKRNKEEENETKKEEGKETKEPTVEAILFTKFVMD